MMFFLADSRISEAVAKASRNTEFQSALDDPAVLADPANLPVMETMKGTGRINLDDTSFLLTADRRLTAPVVDGIAEAMSTVFLTGGYIMLTGFTLAFLLPAQAKKPEPPPTRAQKSKAATS